MNAKAAIRKQHVIALVRDEHLGRGERVIMVNGERWGRTSVEFNGMHGIRYKFRQEGRGGFIQETTGKGKDRSTDDIVVRTEKRRLRNQDTWRPSEERLIERIQQMIDSGHIKHPDVINAENERTRARIDAQRRRDAEERDAVFGRKADEVIGSTDIRTLEMRLHLRDRIIEAMRWAQSQ